MPKRSGMQVAVGFMPAFAATVTPIAKYWRIILLLFQTQSNSTFPGGTMLRSVLARALPFSLALAFSVSSDAGQTREIKNPVEGQPKAIERGDYVYKRRCASCHGFDARGYRATDLTTGQFPQGTSDAQLYRVITRGIPGTEMPGGAMDDDDVWALIAYMRTLVVSTPAAVAAGNADSGQKIYSGKAACSSCHMVNGKRGRPGPELS